MAPTRRVVLLVALLVAFAAVLVAVETKWGPLHRLDNRVVRELHRRDAQHPAEVSFWRWVSAVGSPAVLRIVAAIAAAGFWLRNSRRAAWFVVGVMGGAWLLEVAVKAAVDRHRPPLVTALAHASGPAFPSGHALTSLVALGVLVLLVPHRARPVAAAVGAVAVVLIGYSRLALEVHYLSDVVGGWLLGAAWLTAAEWVTSSSPPPVRSQICPGK